MSAIVSDLLFYSSQGSAPSGWKETLAAVHDTENRETISSLIRRMVAFATEFSLDGNIWQCWLTYMLMTYENAFTLTCERKQIDCGSTLLGLAADDLNFIWDLYSPDPAQMGLLSVMLSYKAAYKEQKQNRVGNSIRNLSNALAASKSSEEFTSLLVDHYAHYGVGIYGLYKAFRYSDEEDKEQNLIPIKDDIDVSFDDLIGLQEQKKTLRENTEAFLNGLNANNVLLYGDSGTGKSTSIHALMHDYYDRGLRLVEITKQNRKYLPAVLSEIKKRNYHFIIYLDDLSFEENESDYKELKAMLEGALEKRSDRVLIYATSNRRHLIRETWNDRNDMEYQGDIHRSDTMEEKLSLASRFGITIYYPKPEPKEYYHIVHELADRNGIEIEANDLHDRARKWELRHGGMSGRTASQLITWLCGEAGNNNL